MSDQALQKGGPVLVLAEDDQDKRERFEKKLAEYKKRLEGTFDERTVMDIKYKITLVEELLEKGEVNTWELSRKIAKEDKRIDADAFQNACGVIHDYCLTGGQKTCGGTGF